VDPDGGAPRMSVVDLSALRCVVHVSAQRCRGEHGSDPEAEALDSLPLPVVRVERQAARERLAGGLDRVVEAFEPVRRRGPRTPGPAERPGEVREGVRVDHGPAGGGDHERRQARLAGRRLAARLRVAAEVLLELGDRQGEIVDAEVDEVPPLAIAARRAPPSELVPFLPGQQVAGSPDRDRLVAPRLAGSLQRLRAQQLDGPPEPQDGLRRVCSTRLSLARVAGEQSSAAFLPAFRDMI